jgi:DNA-binding NarL/FixJ family response regulator
MATTDRAPSRATTRLVLVDDNRAVLEHVIELLPAGFDVCTTLPDGRDLLAVVRRTRPDIVVLDVTLPDASGIELTADLARRPDRPRIVILTIHADDDYVRAALAAGADAYVTKMRLHTDLVPALRAVLTGGSFVSLPGLHEARIEPRRLE